MYSPPCCLLKWSWLAVNTFVAKSTETNDVDCWTKHDWQWRFIMTNRLYIPIYSKEVYNLTMQESCDCLRLLFRKCLHWKNCYWAGDSCFVVENLLKYKFFTCPSNAHLAVAVSVFGLQEHGINSSVSVIWCGLFADIRAKYAVDSVGSSFSHRWSVVGETPDRQTTASPTHSWREFVKSAKLTAFLHSPYSGAP